jgi:glycosyltransferase involved in cell wall biosynthesis
MILHGTECNNFPEYHYGFKMRPWLFWFSQKSMAMATRLLPVSESLIEQDYTYASTTYTKQGIRAFYPDIVTPATVIYNGVLPEDFNLIPSAVHNPGSFITVSIGIDERNRRMLKGLDFVCELAEQFPDNAFTFVGGNQDPSFQLPSNIRLIPHMPNEELQSIYNQHQFYLQLSVSEGFGISVVEAMMCGCIPIVSAVGILPGIVGPYGYVLLKKDINLAVSLVHQALMDSKTKNIKEMRHWAIDHYALDKREKALLAVLPSNS